MKSALPYYGLAAPALRALLRPHLAAYAPRLPRGARGDRCWRCGTAPRTGRSGTPRSRWPGTGWPAPWRDVASLATWRHLVVTGAWWDVVDETAAHLVGDVLARHRAGATPVVRGWATDDDLWLRRTSVIAQLGHRSEHRPRPARRTRSRPTSTTPSFWLRKAIGWALRDYARTDPDWVRGWRRDVGRPDVRAVPA